jgi:ABC-2 type transport system ATP-binding protein
MLDRLRETGTSLLLTTHQLEEAETRSDRVVIIDHGQVIASGTLRELIDRTVGAQRTVKLALDRAPSQPIAGLEANGDGAVLRTRVGDVPAELPALLSRVQAAGCHVEDVEVHRPSLQAVFLHLTGRELRE